MSAPVRDPHASCYPLIYQAMLAEREQQAKVVSSSAPEIEEAAA